MTLGQIIRKIGFTPTTHEPRSYWGIVKGQKTYMKGQVDDFFAVAAQSTEIVH
jgi:hypothetical protein